MASKDPNKQSTKTSLMDELKSIKGVLNTDDDNIPLLLDDKLLDDNGEEDIPVLADDDIPVLTAPDEAMTNKSSLDAAIRQLESMELAPRASKTRVDKPADIAEQIRSNAAPPLFDDKATMVRANPFLTKNPTDRFAESRKQAEEALMSVIAHSKSMSSPAKPAAAKAEPQQKPVQAAAESVAVKSESMSATVEEDASADILKLLDDESTTSGSGFGELIDIDVDALANNKPPAQKTIPTASTPGKKTDAQIDAIIDEVVEEYMIILEAALRKKLKEKLPELLKK
jgi:hypothetical protein